MTRLPAWSTVSAPTPPSRAGTAGPPSPPKPGTPWPAVTPSQLLLVSSLRTTYPSATYTARPALAAIACGAWKTSVASPRPGPPATV